MDVLQLYLLVLKVPLKHNRHTAKSVWHQDDAAEACFQRSQVTELHVHVFAQEITACIVTVIICILVMHISCIGNTTCLMVLVLCMHISCRLSDCYLHLVMETVKLQVYIALVVGVCAYCKQLCLFSSSRKIIRLCCICSCMQSYEQHRLNCCN